MRWEYRCVGVGWGVGGYPPTPTSSSRSEGGVRRKGLNLKMNLMDSHPKVDYAVPSSFPITDTTPPLSVCTQKK